MKHHKNDKCRYCSSTDLHSILNLGDQPPSNSFIDKTKIHFEQRFPLEIYLCRECYLVQLLDVVSASDIFGEYHYTSSSSIALVNHFKKFTSSIVNDFELKDKDLVVDIGCNDGVTLESYPDIGLLKVGVEPSSVGQIAKNKKLDVVSDFFSLRVAQSIVNKYGPSKVVTATNVFAHIDNMSDFIKGIPILLDDEGVFIVEVSYLLDLIDSNLFDTIYHEHLCYLSLTPLIRFLESNNLDVFDVKRNPIGASGPSITVYIKKSSSTRAISKSVQDTISLEEDWGVGDMKNYIDFSARVSSLREDTLKILDEYKMKGIKIGGFGAPAKGNTLLNYYNLSKDNIVAIADNTELKQGKVTPGSHIPIISDNDLLSLNLKYALLLSWNYKDYFIEESDFIKSGGKFIVPLPYPHIAP
jgi:hypothetical protein